MEKIKGGAMEESEEGNLICKIYDAMNNTNAQVSWFVAFGTLLYFIRDKNMGKKFKTDFDIAVFLTPGSNWNAFMLGMEERGFHKKRVIINDVTNQPLQAVFSREEVGFDFDLFFMIESGNYIWHTFDTKMENPRKGIPSEYVFKGVEKAAFHGGTIKYLWNDLSPGLNFPIKYGTLLDKWYPGWFIPDARFGQSKCDRIVKMSSCKDIKELS